MNHDPGWQVDPIAFSGKGELGEGQNYNLPRSAGARLERDLIGIDRDDTMGQFDKLKSELKEIYERRGIRRVVYFHCDHWEPWSVAKGQRPVCERNVEHVHQFIETTKAIDFARRLTLFYKPDIQSVITNDVRPGVRGHPEDGVIFVPKTAEQLDMAQRALGRVDRESDHEIQVHIHHENFTFNHGHSSERAQNFFADPASRIHEEERFDLAVKLWLKTIEEETGRKFDRWFFVHGQWALNASDGRVCHLVREIEILLANGCRGDFTIPSGRPEVNPRLEVPFFVKPVAKPKGYDLDEAEPESAYGNKSAAERNKFFIWSSPIKHKGAALDYYASWLRKRLDEMSDLAKEIVSSSFAIDGVLFVKSHAHSLHPLYFEDTRQPVFPHQHPSVQNLFSILFDAAESASAPVSFLTASEVYDLFVNAEFRPDSGFALTIPGTFSPPQDIIPPPASFRQSVGECV